MICPKCGGGGKVYCTMCKGTGLYHEEDGITNEEYMQTCSSDELANTIFRLIVHGTVIRPDKEYIKKWLKEKYNEM